MLLPFVVAPLASAAVVGLAYLFCYGGFEGPVDWAMNTTSHGSRDRRVIALTFDDGPDPARTPALLDALGELGVPGTFFVVGKQADAHPELVARMAREGHELGNHTYSHRYLPLARAESVAAELAETDAAIERATGLVPKLARPPWGGRSPSNVRVFDRLAKKLVLWDVNSYDWKDLAPAEVVERVIERARPGSIVLLHDGGRDHTNTIEAVRLLVPELRARGYELATVSGALGEGAQGSFAALPAAAGDGTSPSWVANARP
jgi:peptidoglycan-N-acetylglucosamine deacetylase